MTQDMKTKWGKVSISDEVIATIAGVAATEGYGIVGMASRKIKDGISELLGRENLSRGVEVSVADDKLIIKLFIAVGYGVRCPVIEPSRPRGGRTCACTSSNCQSLWA